MSLAEVEGEVEEGEVDEFTEEVDEDLADAKFELSSTGSTCELAFPLEAKAVHCVVERVR